MPKYFVTRMGVKIFSLTVPTDIHSSPLTPNLSVEESKFPAKLSQILNDHPCIAYLTPAQEETLRTSAPEL